MSWNPNLQVTTVGQQGPAGPPGPIGPGGNSMPPIKKITSDYTATSLDYTLVCDTTAGNINLTLSTCASLYNATTNSGSVINIAKPVSANQINIILQGSDTINGQVNLIVRFTANLSIQAGPGNKFIVL